MASSSSSVQTFSQREEKGETNPELYRHFTDLVSSLPSSKGFFYKLYRHDRGWHGALAPMVADACFAARPSDIVVATLPKSGTTWIKSLLYATVHRGEHPPPVDSAAAGDHPFNASGPHELIKFFEFQLYAREKVPSLDALPDPRLFSTHVPFASLPRSVAVNKPGSPCSCKVVYVCRDPKDQLVSHWAFANKSRANNGLEPLPLETAAELFCDGMSPFGPFWDHVLGYWQAHVADPEKLLFFRYEEMRRDPAAHVRRLAEFVGLPFSSGEEDAGAVDAIVELCSFERMSTMAATKEGRTELAVAAVPNSAYFRRGVVGDWANHLSPEMARRIDAVTEAKLEGTVGLSVV